MVGHAFFFSYARVDRRNSTINDPMSPNHGANLMDSLFEQLRADVQGRIACADELAGYRDTDEIDTGDVWPKKLAGAVCNSRTLVALITPNYLERPNCVREFHVFRRRFDLAENCNYYHIVPIFWQSSTACLQNMPSSLRTYFNDVQRFSPNLPEEYPATIGLLDAWRTWPAQKRDRIVIAAANRIVTMIQTCELPPLEGFETFHELPDMFERDNNDQERAQASSRSVDMKNGPVVRPTSMAPLPILSGS